MGVHRRLGLPRRRHRPGRVDLRARQLDVQRRRTRSTARPTNDTAATPFPIGTYSTIAVRAAVVHPRGAGIRAVGGHQRHGQGRRDRHLAGEEQRCSSAASCSRRRTPTSTSNPPTSEGILVTCEALCPVGTRGRRQRDRHRRCRRTLRHERDRRVGRRDRHDQLEWQPASRRRRPLGLPAPARNRPGADVRTELEGMLVDVHRRAVRQRVLRAGPLRPGRADRRRAAVPVHAREPAERGRLHGVPRRSGDSPDRARRRQQQPERRHQRPGRRRAVLLPDPGLQHDEQVPRRRQHHRPDRRARLGVRGVARQPDPGGVRLHVHPEQHTAGRAGSGGWDAEGGELQRAQLLHDHRHGVNVCGPNSRSAVAAPTRRPSSTASATRSCRRSPRSTPTSSG